MLKRIVLLAAFLSLPLAGFAEEDKPQGSGPNPYSECGLGAAIFGDIGWAAAISNVIWDLGITAITSALSSPETCNAKKAETAILILETLPGLEQDLAAGAGDHLATLSRTIECDAENQAQFSQDLRAQYKNVVADPAYMNLSRVEKASRFYAHTRDAASNRCTALL